MGDDIWSRRDLLRAGVGLASLGLAAPWLGAATQEEPWVYPADSFSRPTADRLRAFATLDGVGPSLDSFARAVHLPNDELRVAWDEAGAFTHWRFNPRGIAGLWLRVNDTIHRAPTSLSLSLGNRSARPLRLALHALELPWVPTRESQSERWILPGVEVAAGAEQRFEFSWSTCRAAGEATERAPRFPMCALLVELSGLVEGDEYDVTLRDLTVHYPLAAGLRVQTLTVPPELRPGSPAELGLRLSDAPPDNLPVDLELRRNDRVLWRVRLTPDERRGLAGGFTLRRDVPWHLAAGRMTCGVALGGYRAAGVDGHEVTAATEVATSVEPPPLPLVERREHGGRPTCFLDGRPYAWNGYGSHSWQPGNVGDFGAAGATLFAVDVSAGAHVYATAAPATWVAPEQWTFDDLEERVALALEANPEARILLRIGLGLPAFWSQDRPDEQVRIDTQAGRLPWWEGGMYAAPSSASADWREAQAEALRTLLRYCRSRPWASRWIAVMLVGEVTEEWFAWASNDRLFSDYSRPSQERFAAWLGEQGQTDLPPEPVPSAADRDPADRDVLPDTPAGRRAADYARYLSELAAANIGHFARIAKAETAGRLLVGLYYGYVIQLAGTPRGSMAGHLALRRVLDEASVDFIGGVPLHDFRRLRGGYDPYVSATESIGAAGKLYNNDNDLFSWLHPVHWHTLYDDQDPRAGAVAMHQRECAHDAVAGALATKFSLMASWHHDAGLLAAFARQAQVQWQALELDRTPVEQIALVVDETSLAWSPPGSTLFGRTHRELLRCLGWTGAPVGVWLLSDLERLPERIRFVVVAGATAPLPADLAKLQAALARGGRTYLVVGMPGLVDPVRGRWQPARPGEILGLPLRVVDELRPGGAVVTADGTWVTPGAAQVRPRAELDGAGFLRYPDGPAAGSERRLPNGGRLVWCGLPPLHPGLLRRWAGEAGVHLYAPEGWFVWCSRELVAVTSPDGGEAELRWPEAVRAEDLFDGWRGEGAAFPCPFGPGRTRLFRVRRKGEERA